MLEGEPKPDVRPRHFARDIRDIAAGDIRDTRYRRDKCWLFASIHRNFSGQAIDPPALSTRVSVLNPPHERAGR